MWFRDGPGSLRWQLATALATGIALTLAVGFFALHFTLRGELLAWARADLEKRLEALAEYAIRNPGRESAADAMLEFRSQAHEDYFEIRDGSGRLLARSSASRGLPLVAPDGAHPFHALVLPDGHPGLAVTRTFALPAGDPRDRLTITVAEESVRLGTLEQRTHRVLLILSLLTVAAALVVTLVTVARGLAPLERLARAATRIDPDGERSTLTDGTLPRELAALSDKLSDLLRRLFDARDRERRLTRSVAHELRTPLAELRLQADVGAMAASLDDARRALAGVGDVATDMQRTIEALFALARYESGQEELQTEPVELRALVRHEVAALGATAAARGVRIAVDAPEECWVLADSAMLAGLVANLLGNAVAHSPRDAAVQVALDGTPELRIDNPAPRLTAPDVTRLQERFFHPPSDSVESHAGLGLTIAGAIAAALALQLTFELRPDGRLVARIGGFGALATSEAGTAGEARTPRR